MDAAQTEKLKALALAATKGPWMRLFGERTVYDRMEDGCRGNAIVRADVAYSSQDGNNIDFIAEANPATVLELIADNERLRNLVANVAPPFAAPASHLDAGDQELDDVRIVELAEAWAMLSDGYESTPLNHCLDFARAIESEVTARCRAEGGDTSEEGDFANRSRTELINYIGELRNQVESGSAPAAGTDKDAEDAVRYRWLRDDCPDFEAMTSYWVCDELDEKIDAAISAHTKAREGA